MSNLKELIKEKADKKDNWKNKKCACIESIELLTPEEINKRFGGKMPEHSDGKPLATICFKDYRIKWCVLGIADLLDLLRLWFEAEEIRYPTEIRYKSEYFFEEIKKVFEKAKIPITKLGYIN